ncbi:MAG: hypothetical protein S4CHLAM2_15980 [Chlamydiales bacterium]|nr:hypothetical protein [Chlamydiales bacterium]
MISWENIFAFGGYRIYRNGVLIGIVPMAGPFTFEDHNQSVGQTSTYTVEALNAGGIVVYARSITLTTGES